MSIYYRCRSCLESLPSEATCPYCNSDDIDVEARYEHTVESDAEAARRLANVAYWNRQYAALDFLSVAKDITNVDTDTVPVIQFARRQAS